MAVSGTRGEPRRLWLDLGDFGDLVNPREVLLVWQDHGMGLLRTILHANAVRTDLASTRACTSWFDVEMRLVGYDVLIMNVRSYTFPMAYRAARIFRAVNPRAVVLVGGMHASVAPDEMAGIAEFDKICRGAGEKIIVDLVRSPQSFPRIIVGEPARSMAEWPMIDRRLWPAPESHHLNSACRWPLEPSCGWGPGPVATVLTSRLCPSSCAFCNESSYIPPIARKPVEMVIDELNYLDRTYGPIGSVVIHDSLFFQDPSWLKEWLLQYPRKARQTWPYWAAARADLVRRWPDLFAALVRETNWSTVSIGFESGSDRVLRILNKQCSEEDNDFTIDLLNRLGDEMEREGKKAPFFWTNIILAIPGERREDALKTMRMIRSAKRQMVSVAFFAPYPGSALGHQLIAEGKSLMTKDNYHRNPVDRKVKGVDYEFYWDLLAGKYDDQIDRGPSEPAPRVLPLPGSKASHSMYLFSLTSGKKKLAYGRTPADALEILGYRLTEEEMRQVVRDDFIKISPRSLQEHVGQLG